MTTPQELYRLQSSLSSIFDRIGLTQEISDDQSLFEFSSQEQDQLDFLIEKYEELLEEIRHNTSYIEETLDQRLIIRLGNYYYLNNNEIEALEYYNISIDIEENEWAYFNSAKILANQRQFNLAVEKYDQAIKIKPDFLQAFRHQAEILIQQGNKEAAFEKLQKCQQINPNDPETNKLLANYYLEHGEKKEALSHLKAIHHRDTDVEEKIEELEHKDSFLSRLTNRLRKK
jgi:tetratricopeptide (TPR) repeat protein